MRDVPRPETRLAGQAIAILSAVTAVVLTIKRRYPAQSVVAIVIT